MVEGKDTGLIVYKDDNTTGLALLPKSKNGAWKIRTLWSKTVYQKAVRATDEGCTVTILQARGTDDFYVNICDDFSHSKPAVSDNRGSDFLCYEEPSYFNTKGYYFYAFVENLDNNYQFTINDKTVTVRLGDKDFAEIIE